MENSAVGHRKPERVIICTRGTSPEVLAFGILDRKEVYLVK